MKYQCLNADCGKFFIHPTKLTPHIYNREPNRTLIRTEESYVCPHCHSLLYEETQQSTVVAAKIVSVKSVSLEEVDHWITEGYTVESDKLYAKTATLIKYALPEPQQPQEKEALQQQEEEKVLHCGGCIHDKNSPNMWTDTCLQCKRYMSILPTDYYEAAIPQHYEALSGRKCEDCANNCEELKHNCRTCDLEELDMWTPKTPAMEAPQ